MTGDNGGTGGAFASVSALRKAFNSKDPNLTRVFIPWVLRHPRYLRGLVRLSREYRKARANRRSNLADGLMVPPFMILSVTDRCNLTCAGCFAAATGTLRREAEVRTGKETSADNSASGRGGESGKSAARKRLDADQWRDVIRDASELGVFGYIIAGGEPFLLPGLLDMCADFSDRFFMILTNGTALGDEDCRRLKKMSNVMVIVSVEGGKELTDARRGAGVFDHAMECLDRCRKAGVMTGISVTVNRINYPYWMEPANLKVFLDRGIRLGVFIEYIPLTPGGAGECVPLGLTAGACGCVSEDDIPDWATEDDRALMLTAPERTAFREKIVEYRRTKPTYIIHSPGDEEVFGGCVSAGRGFAHVTPAGDLTPCPVSNIATHNLTREPVRAALASPLFSVIRENEHLLETDGMPCALFAHPEEVDRLAKDVGAYRTG
jgi:MoaA/NifB/PqqE/SkfB family radical SAM enzyme